MKNLVYIILASLIFIVSACNLERSVDLNLPTFEPKLVVECYLEIGKPYRVVLTESVGYFGAGLTGDLPVVGGATIVITYDGVRDTLEESLFFDFVGGQLKVFNYGSNTIVPENFTNEFHLEVVDSLGRTLTASTQMKVPIPLDSIQNIVLQDSSVSILTIHTDPISEKNYYYRTLHRTNLIKDSLIIGFVLDDEFINNEATNQMIVGAPPFFQYGDTAIVTLFHITEGYANFLSTTGDAEQNNGNPFATPGSIQSNVSGGLGTFTGLNYVRDTFYLN